MKKARLNGNHCVILNNKVIVSRVVKSLEEAEMEFGKKRPHD